jgi:hypothetical protein
LALYPELYGFISETGEKAVTYENGQIKIADWARK